MRIDTQLNWITLDSKTIIRKSAIEEIDLKDNTVRLTSNRILKFEKRSMEDLLDKLGVITEFPK